MKTCLGIGLVFVLVVGVIILANWLKKKAEQARLDKLKKQQDIPGLIKMLENDKGSLTFEEIASALVSSGESSIEPLLKALREDRVKAKAPLAEVLDELGWKPVPNSEDEANYSIAKEDWKRCIEIGNNSILPLINRLETAPEVQRPVLYDTLKSLGESTLPALKEAAIQHDSDSASPKIYTLAMAKMGTPAMEPLVQIILDTSRGDNLREGAAQALGEIGDENAVKSLTLAFNTVTTQKKWSVAYAIIDALGAIGGNSAFDYLVKILEMDIDPRHTIEALVRSGSPYIQKLLPLLASTNGQVLVSALKILGRIGEPAVGPLVDQIRASSNIDTKKWYSFLMAKSKTSEMDNGIQSVLGEGPYVSLLRFNSNKPTMTPLIGTPSPEFTMDMNIKFISKEIGPVMTALIAAVAKSKSANTSSMNVEQVVQTTLQKLGWNEG